MIWPLSTSAICYSTLYHVPHTWSHTLQSNNNIGVGNVCGWKAFPPVTSLAFFFLSFIYLRLWDWDYADESMLYPLPAIALEAIPSSISCMWPLEPLPITSIPPSMVLRGPLILFSGLDLKLFKPKTLLGFTSDCFSVWKLHMAVEKEKHCMSWVVRRK